jgi:diadenylate cyclase
MNNFDVIVIQIYLLTLIINILKNKSIIQGYRFLKFLILAMFAYAIVVGANTQVDAWEWIIKGLPLIIVLGVLFEKELGQILKDVQLFEKKVDNASELESIRDEVIKSILFMSSRKIGALITLEKTASLDEFVKTAYPVNAKLSNELLSTLFVPETPLHDGGVIIKNGFIICAGAYYPPTERLDIPKQLGSRHRAAIGVSEISDALTIVVSEQTGNVSIALNGYLDLDIDNDTFIEYLNKHFQID